MINLNGNTRYMLKFFFVRTQEPYMGAAPSWDHHDDSWAPVDGEGQDDDAAEGVWRWLLGKAPTEPAPAAGAAAAPTAVLAEDNEAPSEKERVDAIFQCGAAAAADPKVARELVDMLGSDATKKAVDGILLEAYNHATNEHRGPRRQSKACNPSGTNPADLDAMHALAAAGAPVLPLLLETLCSPSQPWWVRAAAAAAIGNLGPGTDAAAEALATACVEDEDVWVRRNAAESLGFALPPDAPAATAEAAANALLHLLADVDTADEFDYEQAYNYLETARQAAATALARVATHPAVAALTAEALQDCVMTEVGHKLNAVTRWSAAVALERMAAAGTRADAAALLDDSLDAIGWRPEV